MTEGLDDKDEFEKFGIFAIHCIGPKGSPRTCGFTYPIMGSHADRDWWVERWRCRLHSGLDKEAYREFTDGLEEERRAINGLDT